MFIPKLQLRSAEACELVEVSEKTLEPVDARMHADELAETCISATNEPAYQPAPLPEGTHPPAYAAKLNQSSELEVCTEIPFLILTMSVHDPSSVIIHAVRAHKVSWRLNMSRLLSSKTKSPSSEHAGTGSAERLFLCSNRILKCPTEFCVGLSLDMMTRIFGSCWLCTLWQ